jgi:predicted lysophospholipase L1 biosynthesis ABC-type transport system permease subunit
MGLAGGRLMTVIGIVGDMHNVSLVRDSRRQVWMPHDLGYFPPRRVVVGMSRAGVAPASIAAPLRAALRELDPDLALANVRTIDDIVVRATAGRRFVLWLLGGFAAIALLLSAVGIYGVLAHLVGQRTQEIGIRRALGAQTPHITRVIAGTVGAAIAAGTAAGLAGAWGVSSLVASLLYEMSATDARVYAAVALFVAAVAALAAWPPARRAARVEPMRALRN